MTLNSALEKTALRIAERNLTSGVWNVETAQLFLKASDEQPDDVLRMLGRRVPSPKTIKGEK